MQSIGKFASVALLVCAPLIAGPLAAQDHARHLPAPDAGSAAGKPVKIADPASIALIVNRDSNDIGFMDLATHALLGRVALGDNVNPHMAAMSPDGRYVVTGGTRADTAYVIDVATLTLRAKIPVGIAPKQLAFSPNGRYYYQSNPDGDSISVIDMLSFMEIARIPGFVEPHDITFAPDGAKAYVGNYGAHWVGVVDVSRHELSKRIQVGEQPPAGKLDPEYLGEIKGISSATPTPDGRYLYAADGDLGVVAVIDTRDDKVVKTIRVGREPWRAYMSHDGKHAIVLNNGDETLSIVDTARNEVVATLEGGPTMTGVNFAAGKAFVISATSGFVYVYDMATLAPKGRLKIGVNVELGTATTDAADRNLYLASSTEHAVYVIDAGTENVEKIGGVGLYPWSTYVLDGKDNYGH